MPRNAPAELQSSATDDSIDLNDRDIRALTEYLTVLEDIGRARGAADLYLVVSQSGSEYLVDARLDACECADAEYRDPEGSCKHVRRVAFATGEREIPAGIDRDELDTQLGEHVSGSPRVAATDGGVTIDDFDSEPENCQCDDLGGDFPCWECYRTGRKEFSDDERDDERDRTAVSGGDERE